MTPVLVECPGGRKVVLVDGVLVYAEDLSDPGCDNRTFDAQHVAEALARAAGVGAHVHRVQLPPGFSVMDEDGPSPRFTFEDVAMWWRGLCEAGCERAAEHMPPPAYPSLAEQLLGVVESTGVEMTNTIRGLVARLEKAVAEGPGGASAEEQR